VPVDWLDGVRCAGGVTLYQALLRNVGTLHVMLRENPISEFTKGERIDAYDGGGSSRSSDKVLVMRME